MKYPNSNRLRITFTEEPFHHLATICSITYFLWQILHPGLVGLDYNGNMIDNTFQDIQMDLDKFSQGTNRV